MFRNYVKYSFWFFLLAAIMSFCICKMTFKGFYIDSSMEDNLLLLAVLVVVFTAAFWLISYSKKTKRWGIAIVAGCFVAAVIAVTASGHLLQATTDVEDNRYQYYLITFVVCVAVWLLSVTRRGLFFLFLAGIIESALIQFLYHNNSPLWLGGFLVCCVICFILRGYYKSILSSSTKKTSFVSTVLVSLVCVVVIAGIAAGIYEAAIKPLSPPAKTVQLYDKERFLDIADRTGFLQIVTLLDPSLTGDDNSDVQNDGVSNDSNKADQQQEQDENGLADDWDPFADTETNPIAYELPEVQPGWIILIIVLIILALVAAKLLHRHLTFKQLEKLPRKEQIKKMYNFTLRKFRQIKQGKLRYETPYEFSKRQKDQLAVFATEQADLAKITDIFVRSSYSEDEVSDVDFELIIGYRKRLYKMLFRYLGVVRYVLRFFTL